MSTAKVEQIFLADYYDEPRFWADIPKPHKGERKVAICQRIVARSQHNFLHL